MMFKDKIFAKLTLTNLELKLYNDFSSKLCMKIQRPKFIIYLRAPVDVICERIIKRGRIFEQNIKEKYLINLIRSYDDFFKGFSKCLVLIIETKNFIFVKNSNNII